MPFNITIDKLLESGETQTVEFKTSFGRKAIETLVAFSNAQGGTVLIGVVDDGSVQGVTIGKETLNDWLGQFMSATSPAGLSEGLRTVLNTIQQEPGMQTKQLSLVLERPIKTIERQIKSLSDKKLIERRGSRKTGGYFVVNMKDGG